MKCADSKLLTLLGTRVRMERKKRRVTQERLAELADLNLSYLSEIERGIANVSLCIVADIAKALEMSVGELLSAPSCDTETPDIQSLVQQVQVLEEKQRKMFFKVAQSVLSAIRDT